MENKDLDISARIEALLFFKGESVKVDFLAKALGVSAEEILEGIETLNKKFANRGIVLIQKDEEVMLGTAPEMSATIEKLIKDELNKDIGKAGLETLSIVLYRGPISRSEINYLRGVNSNYILRNLEVRGLIERIDKGSARSVVYRPSFDLLSYMGISKVEDLPEYESMQGVVDEIKAEQTSFEVLPNEESNEESNKYEEEPDRLVDEED
ncbi:MAG: SMC-Scp complex subunit ScpB [Candidatus Yonathbacteria bacterium]|nr:SMC-Scp complex subunit ScpB [Candidatus Yonathbacteria bacterium]